ncbi:MAG: hypothetical protein Q9M44_07610 [Ghiorsea sp.]|nr:hypothetical protein [Ghiorsea sp.]
MKKIMKNGLMALTASLLLLAASGTAHAIITAGGSTIHNAATLTFTGGSATSSVDVTVNTIASAPTISVDSVAQSVNANTSHTYTYSVTNTANGTDVFSFAANSGDVGVNAAPGLDVNGTGGISTSLTLGGSVTTAANTVANTIVIPAGSETNLAPGDTINIGGNEYTIDAAGIAPGTIANTPGATTNAEVPTVITVTPVGASPVIAIGAIAAGTQIGEVQTFTVVVTADVPTVPGVDGTHTVNLTGTTTAVTQGPGGAAVTYATSAGALNETITTVLSPNVTLLKEVRNVTQGGVFGVAATAQSGDTLEYRLTATVVVGASSAASLITDEVPVFTTYVAGTTQLNGGLVADGPLTTLPTTAANGGLSVNSTGAGAGQINTGSPAVVTFQVTVD